MLIDMVDRLQKAGVRFVVIGGVSAGVHGVPWLTDDLDICYATDGPNLHLLAQTLQAWNAAYRGQPETGGQSTTIDADALRESRILNLRTDHGNLDVLGRVAGIGSYEACLAASDALESTGLEFPALSIPALISAKTMAGRDKDEIHIRALKAAAKISSEEGISIQQDPPYKVVRETLRGSLKPEDALATALAAFQHAEQYEIQRRLSKPSAGSTTPIPGGPSKKDLISEITDLLTEISDAAKHQLSTNEKAVLRRTRLQIPRL